MTLYDRRAKVIRLFLDNLHRGTITINIPTYTDIREVFYNEEDLLSVIRTFTSLESEADNIDPSIYESDAYQEAIDELYQKIEEGRVAGYISGEFRDFDLEEKVSQLEKDNKRLASELALTRKELDLYKLPPENKNFQGVR